MFRCPFLKRKFSLEAIKPADLVKVYVGTSTKSVRLLSPDADETPSSVQEHRYTMEHVRNQFLRREILLDGQFLNTDDRYCRPSKGQLHAARRSISEKGQ